MQMSGHTLERTQVGVLLIVDDEPNVRSALRRYFRPRGYQTLSAENGEAAVRVLEENRVDVLITDMRMPGMNGSELLKSVTQRWPDIVRILLTAYADLHITTEAVREGWVDHFLTKPWDADQIRSCVQKGVKAKRG